jgi:hydrogenase expression/formation protein HypC
VHEGPNEIRMCLAIPGRIDSITDNRGLLMARVDFGGVVKEVCLAYLPDAKVGDYAIVHVGFAIAKLDEAAAKQSLAAFDEIAQIEAETPPSHPTDTQAS